MPNSNDISVLVDSIERETEAAILVKQNKRLIWIPRTAVPYLKKEPDGTAVLTMSEWWANQKGLDYD